MTENLLSKEDLFYISRILSGYQQMLIAVAGERFQKGNGEEFRSLVYQKNYLEGVKIKISQMEANL